MLSLRYLTCPLLACGISLGLMVSSLAGGMSLYLKDGSVVKGEITDRSPDAVTVRTSKGSVKVLASKLMPISLQQLRLPQQEPTVQVETKMDPDMESLIKQLETLLAENESLKKQIAVLRQQNSSQKTADQATAEAASPAEGPQEGKP